MSLIFYWLLNPINDINTQNPPVSFQSVVSEEEHPKNAYDTNFVEIQKRLHPEVKPLDLSQSTAEAFAAALAAAKSQDNWSLTVVDEESYFIQGVATTPTVGFKDDFAIQVVENGDLGSRVHMRSKSRLGRNDFGANAKRIVNFFSAIEAAL